MSTETGPWESILDEIIQRLENLEVRVANLQVEFRRLHDRVYSPRRTGIEGQLESEQ